MRKGVVTTLLTIGGVLAAGSAAALVNSTILGEDSARMVAGRSSGDETVGSAPTGTDGTPASGTSVLSDPTGITALYPVGDCGTVTLDTTDDDDELSVVAVDPAAGCTVVRVSDGDEVRVVFRSATTEITFRATLLYGVVGTSVEQRSLGTAPGSGSDDDGDDSDDDTDDSVDDDGADDSDDGSDDSVDDSDDDTDDSVDDDGADDSDDEVDDDSVDDDKTDD